MAPNLAESKRLWLQPLRIEDHLHGLFEIMSEQNSQKWASDQTKKPHLSVEETRTLMLNSMPTAEEPWNKRYAVVLRPWGEISREVKPKMIGVIGLPREAEIGYKINVDYWGKGYMTEALTLFVKLFFNLEENKKYDRLFSGADPENVASNRVLEKAGFQKGELSKGLYERLVGGEMKKCDIQFYFLDRPSMS